MIASVFQKQDVMRRVVYSLIPILLFSVLLYGWRVLAQMVVVFSAAILTEYIFTRRRGKKVSEAVLVTSMIYLLALPPALPLWISAVGIIFAVALAKEAYGGFGRNVFNVAIAGRLFIYLSFPVPYNRGWMQSASLGPNGITGLFGTAGGPVDAASSATPLRVLYAGDMPNMLHQFLGFRSGSMGESSVLLILLAAIYLVATKTANWRPMVFTFLGALISASAFFFAGLIPGMDPTSAAGGAAFLPVIAFMMSGSILYVAVFMATDPITAPNKPAAQVVYGLIIGLVTMLVRVFAGFPEGTSFGIMVANTFALLLDEIFPKPKKKQKVSPGTQKKTSEEVPA